MPAKNEVLDDILSMMIILLYKSACRPTSRRSVRAGFARRDDDDAAPPAQTATPQVPRAQCRPANKAQEEPRSGPCGRARGLLGLVLGEIVQKQGGPGGAAHRRPRGRRLQARLGPPGGASLTAYNVMQRAIDRMNQLTLSSALHCLFISLWHATGKWRPCCQRPYRTVCHPFNSIESRRTIKCNTR